MPILLEGKGGTPTWEDIDALFSKIRYQIDIQGPEILAAIVQRRNEEKEKQIKFIEESNSLKPGQRNVFGELHKSSDSRYGTGLFSKIIAAEVRRDHPRRSGWRKRRQQLAEEIKNMEERQFTTEDIANSAFAKAEEADRRNRWRNR